MSRGRRSSARPAPGSGSRRDGASLRAARPAWPLPPRALVGMVHVGALPGTPRASESLERLAARAVDEARSLERAGFHAVLLENMHDLPYLRGGVGPEIVAGMTAVACAVRQAVGVAMGVQVLAAANTAALAVALAASAQFIRAEGFVYAAVADEGLLGEADAGPLLRYRRAVGAESIAILADIQKKHSSHAITADLDVAELAKGAEFFGADAVVVTGMATGEPTADADVRAAKAAVDIPVVVGSGATPENASALLRHADALIVGSWIKRGGAWDEPVDPRRARRLVQAAQRTGSA